VCKNRHAGRRAIVRTGPALLGVLWLAATAGCWHPRGNILDRLAIGEVMMHSEFAENLRALAMPGGRLTGTENAERATQFVADKARVYGLHNVRVERFDMSCWTVRGARVTVLADPPCVIDGVTALARTLPTPPGGVTAEVLDVGAGTPAEFAAVGPELHGRFALVRDDRHQRRDAIQNACDLGAAGIVFLSPPDRPPIIGNGHLAPRPEPAVVLPYEAELDAPPDAKRPIQLKIELDTEVWDCRPGNVVAELPGMGPPAREIVILCAHLDSWHLAEGAMDNGSGAAVVLETARALAAIGWRPRRTVRFVWFMAEELLLEGSEAYVRQHESELDRIVAVVNVDMPGAPRKFGVFGHPEIEPFLQTVRADLRGYELDPGIAQWSWESSDHAPFMRAGVCALSLAGELGPGVKHYHTAGDVYDTVDRRGTVQSSAVLAVLVRRLADAPERPTRRHAASRGSTP